MNGDGTELAESGWATNARDFIPETHRGLPMLRLYLPFRDRALGEGNNVVRWSRYVAIEEYTASLDWLDTANDLAAEKPSILDLVSCMGELDEETAGALRDAIRGVELQCLRWMGYWGAPHTSSPRQVFGEEYFQGTLNINDVQAGRRVPEFAWDAEGRLAWGGRLYPDSLIVAAELPMFRQLMKDSRIDTVSVRVDRDVLPPSAGD